MTKKFGRWTTIELHTNRSTNGHLLVKCRCDCGTIRVVNFSTLAAGNSKSCGCARLETLTKYHKKCTKFLASIKCHYNLFPKDWTKLVVSSNGICGICNNQFKNARNVCIDHNHETNKVRGLLCEQCNFGLGFFNTSNLCTSADKYLLESFK
jgi:hypothetical protein